MQPALHFINDDIKLNIETLHFLLESEDRNLLGELVTEAVRYHSALDAINERSRLHREEVQPLLERAGIVEGGDYSLDQMEKALGNRLYITMQRATEQAIDHVDNTVVSLKRVADKLRDSLKKQYPNEIIIGFEITEIPKKIDMNKSKIFEFLNTNPVFHLATVEGDKPHVRGMLLYRADENGIIFHTGKMKDIHKQLTENPNVEMCFNNGNFENLIQIRVSGAVELIEDLELKKEIVQKREFLKPWVEQMGYEFLAVCNLKKGIATIWTMKTNFTPKEFVEL